MKKFFIILSLAGVVGFTSCKNENTVNPQPSMSRATIKGVVYAELDNTRTGKEFAPAGTKITVTIDTKKLALNPDSSASYGTRYYQTTVDANGNYSINIDLNSNQTPVSVDIIPSEFLYDEITGTSTVDKNHLYTSAPSQESIYPNATFYHDLNY